MAQSYWNATLYDTHHSFVSQYGESLIDLLAPKKDEHILDLGCGTGNLTASISSYDAQVIGIDQSETMIKQAKDKYPNLTFSHQDILALDKHNTFDAIFSNAVLHWVKQPEEALQRIHTALKQDGRFVAEFGGYGNIERLTSALIPQLKAYNLYNDHDFPWYFPSVGVYTSLMEKAGFHVTFALLYDRPTPLKGDDGLRRWMEMFAAPFFQATDGQTKEHILSTVEERLYDPLYQNGE